MDLEFLGDSSCVAAAGYKAGYLCVQFQDGSIYSYESIEPSTWIAMKRSSSKGFYFNKYIRNNYSFIHGEPPDTGEINYIDAKYFDFLKEVE